MRNGKWKHAKKRTFKPQLKILKTALEIVAYIVTIVVGVIEIFKEFF